MRAVGIVRQSRGRDDSLSPADQRARMEDHCRRESWDLVAVHEEIDVSGGLALAERKGLGPAVEAVEEGRAAVVMVAYFDRLFRSLEVQREAVRRVEEAGGQVVALDFGRISEETATQWLSGTIMGAFAEYWRRSVKERAGAAQARAIERGAITWPAVPPGYVKGERGILEPGPDADVVRRAFKMRAEGATIREIREHLRRHGIERSYHGVQSMLTSRVYLGEVHFGKLSNTAAHEPLVERDTWQAAQRPPRGARAKSERLLARLGVLRCGTCGSRMVVGSSHHGRYPIYRCPPTGNCPRRVTIGAEIAERAVVEAVIAAHGDAEGRASAERRAQDVIAGAEKAQADLDSAIRAFAGLEDEPAARERLAELRAVRDAAVEEVEQLGPHLFGIRLSLAAGWDSLSSDEQRSVIRTTVERASVEPGRGKNRVTVRLFE